MNRLSLCIFCAVLLAVCGVSQVVYACMPQGFRPTNFDLVKLADAIVVAIPQSEKFNNNPYDVFRYGNHVTFQVDRVLKSVPDRDIKTVTIKLSLGETSPSDPNDILGSHPEAAEGSCQRQRVEKGQRYVIFLRKGEDGRFEWLREYPYSRVAEDYYGDESLWVLTIRYYLEVQKELDPLKQLEILKNKYQLLIAKGASNHKKQLALDIQFHLANISPYKPTAYLIEAYKAIDEGRKNHFSVLEDEELTAYYHDKMKAELGEGFDPRVLDFPTKAQKIWILKAFLEEDHSDAMSFFDELMKKSGQDPNILDIIEEYYSKYKQ